jgi:hypothetical protein
VSRPPIKPKSVRVPDDLWRAAQVKADERGEVLSEVIRAALERYVRRPSTPRDSDSPPPLGQASVLGVVLGASEHENAHS